MSDEVRAGEELAGVVLFCEALGSGNGSLVNRGGVAGLEKRVRPILK